MLGWTKNAGYTGRNVSLVRKVRLFLKAVYIYSVSQKWVHPSHFSRYLSISLHETTLTKWHFDHEKSSVCSLYNRVNLFSPQNNSKYIHVCVCCSFGINKWGKTATKQTQMIRRLFRENESICWKKNGIWDQLCGRLKLKYLLLVVNTHRFHYGI